MKNNFRPNPTRKDRKVLNEMESLRSLSIKIFKTALSQADAFQAVLENLSLKGNILRIKTGSNSFKEFDLSRFKKIQVLGAGKSATPMAAAC